jgi:hypothetical protein
MRRHILLLLQVPDDISGHLLHILSDFDMIQPCRPPPDAFELFIPPVLNRLYDTGPRNIRPWVLGNSGRLPERLKTRPAFPERVRIARRALAERGGRQVHAEGGEDCATDLFTEG